MLEFLGNGKLLERGKFMKFNKFLNLRYFLLLILGIILIVVFARLSANKQEPASPQQIQQQTSQTPTTTITCAPTKSDGQGPFYKSGSPERKNLAPPNAAGEKLIISGKILGQDCKTPIADAVLDIWHADSTGQYNDFWYRGKVRTNQEGFYQFETIRPSGYGSGTGRRPPHIHYKVLKDGAELLTSQMYFDENAADVGKIVNLEKRESTSQTFWKGTFNIILQNI